MSTRLAEHAVTTGYKGTSGLMIRLTHTHAAPPRSLLYQGRLLGGSGANAIGGVGLVGTGGAERLCLVVGHGTHVEHLLGCQERCGQGLIGDVRRNESHAREHGWLGIVPLVRLVAVDLMVTNAVKISSPSDVPISSPAMLIAFRVTVGRVGRHTECHVVRKLAVLHLLRENIGRVGPNDGVLVIHVLVASTLHDVTLYLLPRLFDVLWSSPHLETRLLVSGRCHDEGVGKLLNPLHSGSTRTHHQSNHTVGNTDEYGDLVRSDQRVVGWRDERTGGSDLRKVNRCCNDLPFGFSNMIWAATDGEDWLFSTHWRLDVCIGLGTKSFDLAACKKILH